MKKILTAIDGSENSLKAAEKAVDIAKLYGCELTFLTVVAPRAEFDAFGVDIARDSNISRISIIKATEEQGERILDEIISHLDTAALKTNKKVLIGDPAAEILDYANDGRYDLIVMGRRGLSKIKRFFIGSITQRILAHATCSILVVKE